MRSQRAIANIDGVALIARTRPVKVADHLGQFRVGDSWFFHNGHSLAGARGRRAGIAQAGAAYALATIALSTKGTSAGVSSTKWPFANSTDWLAERANWLLTTMAVRTMCRAESVLTDIGAVNVRLTKTLLAVITHVTAGGATGRTTFTTYFGRWCISLALRTGLQAIGAITPTVDGVKEARTKVVAAAGTSAQTFLTETLTARAA